MLTVAVNATRSRFAVPVLRLLRWVLVVLLVLLVVFYLGGGWYFSARIRADGLEVKPYPVERNLSLTPMPGAQVRIRSSDSNELRMVRAPSTFGLKWRPGGYGRVSGPVVSQSSGQVVRRFEVVTGQAPATGAEAELDLVAYPDDPTYALGPGVRTVTYGSPLGRFPAWFVGGSSPEAKTWAILVHGKGGSRREMFRMTRATVAAGLQSLDITYRNDEGRPQDPSGFYQYGRTEWRDLEGAVAYATAHGADRVVLGADSMGGAIVASYLQRRKAARAPEVVGLVLDAPMLDFGETISFGARQVELPLLGQVPSSLTWGAKRIAAARFGLDWGSLDYLASTSWLQAPALVFHGTADLTVPISTSRALARAEPELVRLVETKGVEHVRSWNADPEAYDAAIGAFVRGLPR